MDSTTMTIRVPVAVHEKLARLSKGTKRSRSFLAAEAVSAYVDRELSIIEGIQQGLADVAAGRVTPHDEVIAELHAVIDAAERKKAAQG
jgi:predicted transcriptional regulator